MNNKYVVFCLKTQHLCCTLRELTSYFLALLLRPARHTAIQARRPVPAPSQPLPGQQVVTLPALEAAKVLVWNEMNSQKIRKADLARMLNVHTPQIDRLFDLKHSSKIEFVEEAAKALGKSLTVSLV